ncbi:MAG: GDP-mannose 4,6-dehydratase [Rhodospirillales bacterium]|nr:GDP-mannose 4,6-dehydratase [Rhodospirillales bacterium]
MKKALILGVTGQDGSYLAEVLLDKGYLVYGMVRRSATGNTRNIQHLLDDPGILGKRLFVVRGDLADPTSLYRIIEDVRPDELYNEADQDHVRWSFDMVGYSSDITGAAVGRLLEIIRQVNPKIRFFQPVSSNIFGRCTGTVQNESTPFTPQSVYAVSKITAYYFTRYYREAFGMHASTGILFNHESPRRSIEYVTRKITNSAARIALGKQNTLVLGDMSARVDWGYAREYMEAAWSMLQQAEPDDYVIATGEAHSVQDFVAEAFKAVNLDPARHVSTSSEFLRPTNTSNLIGDASKARARFGFAPKVKFKELVKLMVEADLNAESGAAR